MIKPITILFFCVFTGTLTFSQQTQFSLATDFSVLRSFKKEQQYWAVGQTVHAHFHFTPGDGAYFWLSYYSEGKFSNTLAAMAKSATTIPQQVNYKNDVQLRFKHISLGWKHYLKGAGDSEKKWNLYNYTGFGLMLGRVINDQSISIDINAYDVPVNSGQANFKRLTLDLGLGFEVPLGGDIYLYMEGRVLVPTTDYPSKYLFVNNNAPFTSAANTGIRILFH